MQFNIEKGEGERCTVVRRSVRRILSLIVVHKLIIVFFFFPGDIFQAIKLFDWAHTVD